MGALGGKYLLAFPFKSADEAALPKKHLQCRRNMLDAEETFLDGEEAFLMPKG